MKPNAEQIAASIYRRCSARSAFERARSRWPRIYEDRSAVREARNYIRQELLSAAQNWGFTIPPALEPAIREKLDQMIHHEFWSND